MAQQTETQDFIDEIGAPSIYTGGEMRAVLSDVAVAVRDGKQQVALLRGLLQSAELVEDEPVVRGKFEAVIQKLRAVDRISGEMADKARELRTAQEGLMRTTKDLAAVAAEHGYTIPASLSEE